MNIESSESAGKRKGLKYNPRKKQTVLKTNKNTVDYFTEISVSHLKALAFKPTCETGALPEHTVMGVDNISFKKMPSTKHLPGRLTHPLK